MDPTIEPQAGRSTTTVEDEVARLGQALLDLSLAGVVSVSLTHCPSQSQEATLVRRLAERARQGRYVTAQVSLSEGSFEALDQLVAEVLARLVAPGEAKAKGLLRLLDAFFERHGKRSVERLEAAAHGLGLEGDLFELSRAYLAEDEKAEVLARVYDAWVSGVGQEVPAGLADVRRALTPRTAQRVFAELSRLLRALGFHGLVVFLTEGEAILQRTERQREKAYTVLRELLDNLDSGRGAMSVKLVLTGRSGLFFGPKSLRTIEPLLTRLRVPSLAEPPPPHRSWTSLVRDPYEYVHRAPVAPQPSAFRHLRTLIRISQGLPPLQAVSALSVAHERIDRTISNLFAHSASQGSVFGVLVGAYGSGKTHILMHLAERALAENHLVFWLNVERLALDLGNPQRHLSRLLEHSVLPLPRRPSALDRLSHWTRSKARLAELLRVLGELAQADTEAGRAAAKAIRGAKGSKLPARALEHFLSGRGLEEKPGAPAYRLDAYRRLLLWVALLQKLEGVVGVVILIDEAENLFTSGMAEAARRACLRSLAFYCGGAVPNASVVMAMTQDSFAQLRREAPSQLRELGDQASLLELEDPTMFKRRISRLEPDWVPELTLAQRQELAEKVRIAHARVRGTLKLEGWPSLVREATREPGSPRDLIRRLVDELEAAWWAG